LILVDTNILIDIATANATWAEWSRQALVAAHAKGPVLFNAIVYSEFAIGFDHEADCDAEIEAFDLTFADNPTRAAFRATQAFRRYRNAGGMRPAPPPDFFIGGHASALGIALLTRDGRRYRTYFPEVALIAPTEA
jgi:predicted nucleic acid-binding protein